MNRILTAAILTSLLLIGLTVSRGKDEAIGPTALPKRAPGVVILQADQATSNNGQLYYQGLLVYNSSSSSNAPTFPNYPQNITVLADALADLLAKGYRIEKVSDNMLNYLLVKP